MAHEGCAAIEDNSDFVRLLRVVNSVMGDVPRLSIVIGPLFMWHPFSETLSDDVLHECHIILTILHIVFHSRLFRRRKASGLLFGSFGVLPRKGSGIS